ncbi:putative ORFan [Tupanvirus deep ocean]|uniref:ORFan n=2 Tax=Tupanvirus TaxID=2094720 RepID=A0AC62A7J1_9VIRU|nr:putative ORFan [Tupanvirus deep ocean]QKU33593.1 putative ORFan [Tupanvirus deep ocean]
MESFDITNIQNDFIYKLVDYYLDEISTEPSENIMQSIANLVDTIMSFYMLAQKSGVIDVTNSRKMLSLKLGKHPNEDIILDQCQQLNNEFEELEKFLVEKSKPKQNITQEKIQENTDNNIKIDCGLPEIDELLKNHEKFMSEVSKQSSDIRSIDNNSLTISETKKIIVETSDINANITPMEVIEKITALENKLKENIETSENTIKNKFGKNTNIISQSAIENMAKNNITTDTNSLNTDEKILIKKYAEECSTTSTERHMDKLDEAFGKLYSRLNTPLINLIIAIIILKITTFLFGF